MADDDLTDKQKRILKEKKKNKDLTNREIADRTGASESYVSQVLNEHDTSDLDDDNSGILLLMLLVLFGLGFFYLNTQTDLGNEAILIYAVTGRHLRDYLACVR